MIEMVPVPSVQNKTEKEGIFKKSLSEKREGVFLLYF
jgi:hypothetical protein